MDQVAGREAQMEHGLIDTYDEYEFDFSPLPPPQQPPQPARRIPSLRRTRAPHGSNRAR
ncbi:hypothetical protein [Streptomyces sp. H27-C3]|uniref:hypothetical protein n=1 Tax=Streptomyces sp. H27-C3 TaxID=3046305 RepID=UPI0024B8A0A7|nr:hypothetical protein [Streptomyces sp. H27-C3]MDJ0464687.1 hypothetical protein [Streptomyces sp. H27-C3]